MAADQAIENNIPTLLDFCPGLTVPEARRLLENNNNDTEKAAGAFYDSTLMTEQTEWNESLMGADRYGDARQGPSFKIENYDARIDEQYRTGGAPTRPPSRNSHHSNMVDIPMSSIEVESGQETGITGNNRPYFGPATKSHYDNNDWALVATGTSTLEFIPDVEPAQRKRQDDEPVFIKPLPNGDYFPALITILHSIPSARNAFLCPLEVSSDYGHDANWWTGTSISLSEPTEIGFERTTNPDLELIHETQRIMAFLDRTDRAYGSVESMCLLKGWVRAGDMLNSYNPPDFHRFLFAWDSAIENQVPDYNTDGLFRSTVNANGRIQGSLFLDTTVVHLNPGESISLYDVLDSNLFNDDGCAFVTKPSNVFILKLTQSNANASRLDVNIPATLYADRYLEENSQAIMAMRQDVMRCEEEIARIEKKRARIKAPRFDKNGNPVDGLVLLKTSMLAYKPVEGEPENPDHTATVQKLQAIVENVERKLKDLDEQTKRAHEAIERISSIFRGPIGNPTKTHPGKPDDKPTDKTGENSVKVDRRADEDMEMFSDQSPSKIDSLKARYRLMGVSTESNIIYIRRPATSPTSNTDGEPSKSWQWWRIDYTYTSSRPVINRAKVDEETVLRKASEDCSTALLVYASDTAIEAQLEPLPKALEDFVKRDNVAFLEELQSADNRTWRDDLPPNYGGKNWNNYEDWIGKIPDGLPQNKPFEDMSAREFLNHQSDEYSSNTLTPDTEMTETNGGAGLVAEMATAGGLRSDLMGINEMGEVDVTAFTNRADTIQERPMAPVRPVETMKISDADRIEFASRGDYPRPSYQ
ncbi:hypothetical protein K432DRAFT_377611 [Lepidopterella palustris CBS 459.81]|uniref:Ubiquitin interaction motif protein n=1 Tax=Lepidopterella palustris CBS 459.81 TaxID=1314670 RepID=A0A8E2JK72_9PEZI|nr:hypothetical protein K432DRAFT_377611 [Lepidopterella palustris CBS 459.81]